MSKSKQKGSSKAGASPAAATWTPAVDSNQAMIDQMCVGSEEGAGDTPTLGLAAQDAAPGAPPKKRGFAKFMGKATGAVQKYKQQSAQAGASFGGAAVRALDAMSPKAKAEKPMTPEQEYAYVNKMYRKETEAFVREKGDANATPQTYNGRDTHAAAAPMLAKAGASKVSNAMSDEERRAKNAQSDLGDDHDPFFYRSARLGKPYVDALRRSGLTDSEIAAVTMYTTQAAYPMNAVLRGTMKDPDTIRAYLPWCRHLEKALAKMPTTARNEGSGGQLIDPTKAPDAQVDIQTVYRSDGWSVPFAAFFHDTMKVSRRVEEPGFLSTTTRRGAYGGNTISRVIDASGGKGRSIVDVSTNKIEDEVLFPPGTQMRITAITDQVTGEAIADPGARYTPAELQDHAFEIHAKIEGGPQQDQKPASGGGDGSADAAKSAEDADATLLAGLLASGPPLGAA